MPQTSGGSSASWVFLNVPYDMGYEKKFIALITAVVLSGYSPHCAVEIPERGAGRLNKIVELMRRCPMSIHDLCRAGSPTRFNMPFELGLAVALRAVCGAGSPHGFILLEGRRGDVRRCLSDLGHIDPILHGHGALRLLAKVLSDLGSPVRPKEAEKVYRALEAVAPDLKREYRSSTLFERAIFEELVAGAVERAEGMLAR